MTSNYRHRILKGMSDTHKALFGAGCFWGVQYYFDQVPGVTRTTVGYSGGHTQDPSYEDVCTHTTGHAEVVEVQYDPQVISFEDITRHFFRLHDPTQLNRQGPDVGDNYRSAIYYYTDEQREAAIKVRDDVQAGLGKPIVTQIELAGPYYVAEDYHQKFTERTGRGMCHVPYKPLAKQ